MAAAWRVKKTVAAPAPERVELLSSIDAELVPYAEQVRHEVAANDDDFTEVWFPAKLRFLFEPKRYKVAWGGRGSGKSWGFARALILMASERKLRILCAREIQDSIEQSVHALLKDQIIALGLAPDYDILKTEIRCKLTGSQFLFTGLQEHTVDSIKSFEGCDIVWVEEAQGISDRSWEILIPTIRKDGSEIWMTLNPQLETDPTYVRFIANQDDDIACVSMSYYDNARFPGVLEKERLRDQAKLSLAKYMHIWEGRCMPAVEGAIYFDEVDAMQREGRIARFPHNPLLTVHRVWDLGHSDAMAIGLFQKHGSAVFLVGYVTGTHRTIADYIAQMRADERMKTWNWGYDFLPHDGYAKRHQTGQSDCEVLEGLGCEVMPVPNMEVEQGIRQARTFLPRLHIDDVACASDDEDAPGVVECLRRYRRRMNKQTKTFTAPLHDVYSNGSDMVRYAALVEPDMTNLPPRRAAADSKQVRRATNWRTR